MFTKSGRKIALEILLNSGGYSVTRNWRLATNVPAGAPEDVVVGDFTECTFPGYAEITDPIFGTATLDGSDRGESVSPLLVWTAGAIVTPETAVAIYCFCNSPYGPLTGLLWWAQISPSVTVANPGESISRIVTFKDNNFVP